jgi:parvulin-like peptidyl-prolyl isomerase
LVAIVNGIRITKEQLRKEKDFISLKNADLDQKELFKQALHNLIDAAIIWEQCESADVNVGEDEIDEALVEFLANFTDEENYKSTLKEVKLTEEELRHRLEMHIRVGKFLAGKIDCEDNSCEEKLHNFYENNNELFMTDSKIRLSHILVLKDQENSKECADGIRAKIKTPEDFLAQVKAVSCCPSIIQNGDLGYLLPGELIPELDKIAFNMKEGEISDVIDTEHGYHILYVSEILPSRQLEFEEVREFLSDYHKKLMMEFNVEKYLNELRKKADIKIL